MAKLGAETIRAPRSQAPALQPAWQPLPWESAFGSELPFFFQASEGLVMSLIDRKNLAALRPVNLLGNVDRIAAL
ncbi:hypothetical protein [Halodurantibacterium flavum]|uniref:Uncharacterized protein n=1 Tax=Halodurantibacterium flavum TaxID=1382802 RepID=A0ABW4S8N8_9RHOB